MASKPVKQLASEPRIQKSFLDVMKTDREQIYNELNSLAGLKIKYTNRRRLEPDLKLEANRGNDEDSCAIRENENICRGIGGNQGDDSGVKEEKKGDSSGAKGGNRGDDSGAKGVNHGDDSGAKEDKQGKSGAKGGKQGESGAKEGKKGDSSGAKKENKEDSGAKEDKQGKTGAKGFKQGESGAKGDKQGDDVAKGGRQRNSSSKGDMQEDSSRTEMNRSSGAIRKQKVEKGSEFTPKQKLQLKWPQYDEFLKDLTNLKYPISLQNVSLNCQDFDYKSETEAHLYHPFDYKSMESSFTSFVMGVDFPFYRSRTEPIAGESIDGPITDEQNLRSLTLLKENNLKLNEGEFVERNYPNRPYLIMDIRNENPICILTGEDFLVNQFKNCSSPTIMFKHNIVDIKETLENLSARKKISQKLRKHELCDPILYYYRNKMINAGGIYWIIQVNQNVYFHDFTSTFHLELVKEISEALPAMMNAYGLHYLYMARNGSKFMENRVRLYTPLQRIIERSISFINPNVYPAEYCLAQIICSEIYIPSNVDFCSPSKIDNTRVGDAKMLHEKFTTNLESSINSLKHCLAVLLRHPDTKFMFPVDCIYVSEESSINFNFDRYLNDLVTKDPASFKEFSKDEFEKKVFKPFMARTRTADLAFRMMVHVLRKFFADCLAHAVVSRMSNSLGISMYYSELAIQAWIAMSNVISPKKPFPLPFQPMFIIGETYYKFVSMKDCGNKEFDSYCKKDDKCEFYELLDDVSSSRDKRCSSSTKPRLSRTEIMMEAFEYFARCILYTNIKPTIRVLSSLSDASCVLVERFLDVCNEGRPNYTSKYVATKATDRISKLMELFDRFNYDNCSLYNISMVKGKYFKIRAKSFIEQNQLIDERAFCQYRKAIKFYLTAHKEMKTIKTDAPILDLTFKGYSDVSLEFIWMLKESEDKDRISYHSDILDEFNGILLYSYCMVTYNVPDTPYLKYRSAICSGLLAEYFYGLYRDCPISQLRQQTVKWFQIADYSFRSFNIITVIEVLKVNIDFVSFCESVIKGPDSELEDEYHIMMLDQILVCVPSLITAHTKKLYGGRSDTKKTYDKKEQRQNATFHGLYMIFLKHVQNALLYRVQRLKDAGKIDCIDIPKDRVFELFGNSIKKESAEPSYLIDLLKKIKKIRDDFLNRYETRL